MVSDRTRIVGVVPLLPRPPRPPSATIDVQTRHAIVIKGARFDIQAHQILEFYRDDECYPSVVGLMEAVVKRYALDLDTLVDHYAPGVRGQLSDEHQGARAREHASAHAVIGDLARTNPKVLLAMLPDTEFLTAIQVAALELSNRDDTFEDPREAVQQWLRYIDKALRKNGLPYRLMPGTMTFAWIGDAAVAEIVQPALLVLADERLLGVRAEFDEARLKRRLGAPKDLEDAVDEAAKAVESFLKVLHHEFGVTPPRSQQVTPLFNSLVSANKLPGYVDKLIAAASGPRNNMASHGQGATVREVPEELAEASIAAAATAITFLAHYLP